MASMQDMPMPGGWSMSMTWMRAPGQTWTVALISFLAMWTTMMLAMMLPALLPELIHFRQVAVAAGLKHENFLTGLAGLAYFLVWSLVGVMIYPLGAIMTSIVMEYPAMAEYVPIIIGVNTLLAGLIQFSAWKSRQLGSCQRGAGCKVIMPGNTFSALRHGIQLGLHCCYCCAGLTLLLLVNGMMNLGLMLFVMVVITSERLLPCSQRVSHAFGVCIVLAGTQMTAQAVLTYFA